MSFEAKILADSVSPAGIRLTTFEVTFPRIVLAEFNTHRAFSRNSASSRAIPVEKMIQRVLDDPYIPTSWGKNQKGMQAAEVLTGAAAEEARSLWLHGRNEAVVRAQSLMSMDVHKQLTNRLLEPFMWHTCIVTATEWSNFFHLRNNSAAHPDIQIPARMMQQLHESNEPQKLGYGEWHLPLLQTDEREAIESAQTEMQMSAAAWMNFVKISAGRCARVSYLTHEGKRNIAADIELHDKLFSSGHMSPFEHVARPVDPNSDIDSKLLRYEHERTAASGVVSFKGYCGNFHGWVQYRKLIPNEHDILGAQN